MENNSICTADNIGFIRLLHPFADEDNIYHQRVHSVTRDANPVTYFSKNDNYFIAGYQNGSLAAYELQDGYLQ